MKETAVTSKCYNNVNKSVPDKNNILKIKNDASRVKKIIHNNINKLFFNYVTQKNFPLLCHINILKSSTLYERYVIKVYSPIRENTYSHEYILLVLHVAG